MPPFSWLHKRLTGRPHRHCTQKRKPSLRLRPRLETLEGRVVQSTLTVTSNGDSLRSAGSLRAEIAAAHAGDTIVFAPSLDGQTIQLGSQLLITKSLNIQGPGAGLLAIRPSVVGDVVNPRIFQVGANPPLGSPVTVTVSGLTLEDGGGTAYGYRPISGGSGWDPPPPGDGTGGAILNYGTLTVSGCALVGNSVVPPGANRYVNSGGAIYNAGTLTLTGSTLSGNSASIWSLSPYVGRGGAVYNVGTANISDCTLANNSAGGYKAGVGGGIFNGGTLTVSGCTVSGNSASYGGGGILDWGTLNLTNTIVAGNTAGTGPDIDGAVATADHNLVGDATGASGIVNGVNGNIVGGNGHPVINADLGPLQNNGGPTETMALLAGSPAIGHADNSKATATDQRGVTRVDEPGETTDIGAFEL
jgi:hypothetical protein